MGRKRMLGGVRGVSRKRGKRTPGDGRGVRGSRGCKRTKGDADGDADGDANADADADADSDSDASVDAGADAGADADGCKAYIAILHGVGPPHLLLRELVVLLELLRCAAVRLKRKERKERS